MLLGGGISVIRHGPLCGDNALESKHGSVRRNTILRPVQAISVLIATAARRLCKVSEASAAKNLSDSASVWISALQNDSVNWQLVGKLLDWKSASA